MGGTLAFGFHMNWIGESMRLKSRSSANAGMSTFAPRWRSTQITAPFVGFGIRYRNALQHNMIAGAQLHLRLDDKIFHTVNCPCAGWWPNTSLSFPARMAADGLDSQVDPDFLLSFF